MARAGCFAMWKRGMAAHVARRRSFKRETIMFTSDHQMGGWAYHWVNQMRQRGYEHWFILGDQESTCTTLSNGWRPMVERFGEEPATGEALPMFAKALLAEQSTKLKAAQKSALAKFATRDATLIDTV